MAKLTLLLATFAVLLLVANASIYRTTIEFDEEDPIRRPGRPSCRQQIQRQQQLNHCQEYMRQECQESERSRGRGRGNPQQQLRECCNQLKELETVCRCQGIRQAVQQQQQREGLQKEELQEMYEIAKDLPSTCGVPPMMCDMRSSWF